MKSNTHFSHADLRVTTVPARQIPRVFQGKSEKIRSFYCEPWNNFFKYSCSVSDPKYKESHLCKVCDSDHPRLHCSHRKFPVKGYPAYD